VSIKPRAGWTGIKTAILVLLVFAVGYLLVSNINSKLSANKAGAQAQAVAQPVDALCAQGGPIAEELHRRGACSAAAQVQQSPAVAPVTTAVPGPAGRGITATAVEADGHLRITYTDGITEDKGVVIGKAGAAGAAGRGIVSTAIRDGHLVLSYSDSTSEDVGQVVGPPGRGVVSTDIVGGRLVVTYSDGTKQDLGPLPVGRGVQKAQVVDCRWRVTYTDGQVEDAGNACATQTVTPTPTTTTSSSSTSPSPSPLLPLPNGR